MFQLNKSYFRARRQICIPYLAADPITFITEWIACAGDKTRDTTSLISYLEPNIKHWITMLTDPHSDKDPMFGLLFNKIETDTPAELLSSWSKQEDLYDILVMAWLHVLRGKHKRRPSACEQHAFLVYRQWVFYLTHVIRSYKLHTRRWSHIVLEHKELSTQVDLVKEDISDILFYERYDPYMLYITNIYLCGYDKPEIRVITKISYEEFEKGVSDKCQIRMT